MFELDVLCNDWIPNSIHAKAKNSQGHSKVNELLSNYAFAFALRYNLSDSERGDMWRSLGKAVAEIS